MDDVHLVAEVDWLGAEEGGRRGLIFTGYRGQFHLHGEDAIAEVRWTLPDGDAPSGTRTVCHVVFSRPEVHLPRMRTGDVFEVREGARVVGRGVVQTVSG